MISEKRVKEILEKTGVLQEGHFLLSSGRHAKKYLQCALVLQYPNYAAELAEGIAELWNEETIETVTGPAVGAIVVSWVVARAIGVRSIFSERKDGKMKYRRGFDVSPGEKVLLVEDVVTTGKSVREAVELLEEKEANIVGISSLIDRSGGNVEFDYPFKSLMTLNVESFSQEECPLCEKGIEFTKPGSRKSLI